jgi:hypothetical protein
VVGAETTTAVYLDREISQGLNSLRHSYLADGQRVLASVGQRSGAPGIFGRGVAVELRRRVIHQQFCLAKRNTSFRQALEIPW